MRSVVKIRSFVLVCSLLLIPNCVRAQTAKAPQASGLLLGLRSDGTTRKYYTLWIAINDRSVQIEQIPGLLVPRDQGFSWIGHYFIVRHDENTVTGEELATFSEDLWLRPADDQSKVLIAAALERVASDEDSDKYCEHLQALITFVGPKYIGLETTGINPCGQNGAVAGSYDMLRIDDLNKSGQSLPSSELLDKEVEKAVEHDRDSALDDDRRPPTQTPGEPEWTLFHQQGSWRLKGWLETVMSCGGGNDYEIRVVPPESLVGEKSSKISWKQIKSKVSTAVDGVSSPRNDALVVVTSQDLLVFSLTAGNIGELLRKFHLSKGFDGADETSSPVVMTQWALGRHVAAWDQEVRRQKEIRKTDQPF